MLAEVKIGEEESWELGEGEREGEDVDKVGCLAIDFYLTT